MAISFYAGILGMLYFKISLDTIAARRREKISLGMGEHGEIAGVVSAHGNFAAYAPVTLGLLYLLEISQMTPVSVVHILGGAFTLGRFLHHKGMTASTMNFRYRVLGMHLTLWPLFLASIANLYVFVRSLL